MPPTLYQYLTRCAKTLAVAATATSLVVLAEVAILGYRTPKLPHATLGDLSGTVTPPSTTTTTTTTTPTPPTTTKNIFRILIFGDSVAAGVGCPSNNQALAGSIARYIAATSNVTVHWEVLATSGYTAKDMNDRLVPQLIGCRHKYDCVVVSVGVNHVLSLHHPTTYALQLSQLFISLKRVLGPNTLVLCNAMPPMEKFPQISYLWPLRNLVARYTRAIGQVTKHTCAETHLATHVKWNVDPDQFNAGAIQNMMAKDGFHPNSTACDLLAQPAALLVQSHLEQRRSRTASSLSSLFDAPIDRSPYHTVKHTFCDTACLPFWVADMDLPTAPSIQQAIEHRAKHPTYGYTIQPMEIWSAVSRWLEDRHQWTVNVSEFIFTSNLVTATVNCLRAFTVANDAVAMLLPLYHPLQNAVEKSNRRLVTINMAVNTETNQYVFDVARMKQTFQQEQVKVLVWCHPHNPGGRVWTLSELKSIVELCKDLNVLIVSDEIHSDLMLFNHKHVPMQLVGHLCGGHTQIVTMHSPGKTFNLAGLHAGFVIIQNPDLYQQYMAVVEPACLHFGSAFATAAMLAAYTNKGRLWLKQLIVYLEQNVCLVEQFCATRLPEIKVMRPNASFLVWLDCQGLGLKATNRNGIDSDLIRFFRTQAKVHLSDGFTFGGDSYAQYQRINIGCSQHMLMEGLKRIEKGVVGLRGGGGGGGVKQ